MRTSGNDIIYEMPQVGPTLPDNVVHCTTKKLEIPNKHIDSVTIYATESGVYAMRFSVGNYGETFGTAPVGATKQFWISQKASLS